MELVSVFRPEGKATLHATRGKVNNKIDMKAL